MDIKLTHSKVDQSLNATQNIGRLQIKKVIYNKAFKSFIKANYGSGIHFGSMNNNLEEILKKLSLDDVMRGVVKLPMIDVNTLSVVNDDHNEFADFDLYDSFTCTFLAKEGISSEKFMEGIETLKTEFLNTYNKSAHSEITEKEHENRLYTKKREIKEIAVSIILAIIALVLIYLFSNRLF
ncbi:hypothetical protein IMCC3317_00730 [Kordia antarctica]|uniref:Uncharacterized protein n=1 Tax=Kordia antarctica TaxID=1218801 RepID=A0A7L4ZDT5_9FLAO|nr:hypothetical protein [Kordia antarctica]QHI34729.1 hypothetical protein IMCC3317_00730 [Kordia antarctica]